VILGWDKGVKTMSKGEVCLLTCAPDYAYGGQSIGPIPANSTLSFEVELLGWKDKEPDNNFSIILMVVLFVVVVPLYFFLKSS
jgi:FK506-binding protein 4/5